MTSGCNSTNNGASTKLDNRGSSAVYCRICHEDSGVGSLLGSNSKQHARLIGQKTPDRQPGNSSRAYASAKNWSLEELIDPCTCSGSLALIHASCLEKWLSSSNTERCEICKHPFFIQRKNKSILKSAPMWLRNRNVQGARGITGDLISLLVLTPLCLAAIYLCAIGASAYATLGFWEGTGLVILSCTLIGTYCLWLFATIRFHYRSLREWREKNQDVKLLVKHCTEEERKNAILSMKESKGQRLLQDRDNSRSMADVMNPRQLGFASWFGANVGHTSDPVFLLQQTTFV